MEEAHHNNDKNLLEYLLLQSAKSPQITYNVSYFLTCFFLSLQKIMLLIILIIYPDRDLSSVQSIVMKVYTVLDTVSLIFFTIKVFLSPEKTIKNTNCYFFYCFKFYFMTSTNILLFLYYHLIPEVNIYYTLFILTITFTIYFSNYLIEQFILYEIYFNPKEILIGTFLILTSSLLFSLSSNNRFNIELIKFIYYITFYFNTLQSKQMLSERLYLKEANCKLINLYNLISDNMVNYSIILKKEGSNFLNIYEKDYFGLLNKDKTLKEFSINDVMISVSNIKNKKKLKQKRRYSYSSNNIHIPIEKYINNHPQTNRQNTNDKKIHVLSRILGRIDEDCENEMNHSEKMVKRESTLKAGYKREPSLFEDKREQEIMYKEVKRYETKSVDQNIKHSETYKNNESCHQMIDDNKINFFCKEKLNYLMISLIDGYDYVNLEVPIKKKIMEIFSEKDKLKYINFIETFSKNHEILEINDCEIGPFNASILFPSNQLSKPFLVSLKIKRLTFVKATAFMVLLRDLECFKKIIKVDTQKEEIKIYDPLTSSHNFKANKSDNYELTLKDNTNINFSDNKNLRGLTNSFYLKSRNPISSQSKKTIGLDLKFPSTLQTIKLKAETEDSCSIFKTSKLSDKFVTKDVKIAALVHDFKNLIYDFCYFIENITMKIPEELRYQFKQDIDIIGILKSYLFGLIRMINELSEGNGFLVNYNPVSIDLVSLINILTRVFNNRQDIENSLKGENQVLKDIKIYSKINQVDFNLLSKLKYNRDLIISLLYNIISNCYKNTDVGEIVIELKMEQLNCQDVIVVQVSDTGRGIPEHILQNWGKAFNKNNKDNNSTGLGQYIIDSISKSLGIFIPKPDSNRNKGTTIKLYFILDNVCHQNTVDFNCNNNENYENLNTLKSITKTTMNLTHFYIDQTIFAKMNKEEQGDLLQKNIILLDDSQFVLNHIEKFLKEKLSIKLPRYEFNIKKACNFFEFFKEINSLINFEKTFDFIILDYNIGENLNGVEVGNLTMYFYQKVFPHFNELNIQIFFITEEDNFYENHKNDSIVKKDHIFTKSSFSKLLEKILANLRDKDY